jgi:hypothetical protein
MVKACNILIWCILIFNRIKDIHLGLCIDEFNPFESFVSSYSCWPVILMVYNLPSWISIRSEFMFLFTVIIGPNSRLGQNIDVCL